MTDSGTVLGYISDDPRFLVFVGNNAKDISEWTLPKHRRYAETKYNPAHTASQGGGAKEPFDNTLWWNIPAFLCSGAVLKAGFNLKILFLFPVKPLKLRKLS